jgi:hypothetical protein
MEPFQVVCIDRQSEKYCAMPVGNIFTVEKIEKSGLPGSENDFFSIEGYTGLHYRRRFKPLEEMQNTNFILIAKMRKEAF